MRLLLLGLIFFTFSCKSQKKNMDSAGEQQQGQLVMLVQDGYFPVESPEHQVIEDAKTLKKFFSEVNRTRKPGIPVPQVDFTKEIVLVACMGNIKTEEYPTMGVALETEDEILVKTSIKMEKGPSAVTSYPFCVYKMPKTPKNVILEIR